MYFCTLSDKKYLLQGLVLYNSLQALKNNFTLFWLCLDEETYEFLFNADYENIFPINLKDLEKQDEQLRSAKNNPPSKYGNRYSQYCWALTPYFINFLFNEFIPENKPLMYIDSDIVFYHSPKLILDCMGEKSIGIHSHQFEGKYNPLTNPTGEFNVGVVVLKNNFTGRACAEWWSDCLLKTNHRYYKIYGTCGDQKYLDLFQPLFGDVCVFDRPSSLLQGEGVVGKVSYLAPWCAKEEKIIFASSNPRLKRRGITNISYALKQPIVFCHFSHFNYDLDAGTWADSNNGEWNPARLPAVKKYYEEYFQMLKRINTSISCSTL